MMTQFCRAEVPLWGGASFWVDGNSKVTAGNGTFDNPKPNAFSLPAITTCPGSTAVCRAACYVVTGLEEREKKLAELYRLNAATLGKVLLSASSGARSANILGGWIADNCPGGFRWHVSGDVQHERHAWWIVDVCRNARLIKHWIYTRTFEVAEILMQAENLVVNLSADRENYREARVVAKDLGLRVCYMVDAFDGTIPRDMLVNEVLFPDYKWRGREMDEPTESEWWQGLTHAQHCAVCPADFFAQSESARCGVCTKCMVQMPAGQELMVPV